MLRLCAFADEYNPSLDKQIEGLKKHGIRLIEFRAVDGKNVADLDDEEAFDFAVKSLKELLEKCGYKEGGEGYLPE